MKAILVAFSVFSATSATAQYRNFEAQPNGYGGYIGTYGNQNFDTGTQNADDAQLGGRRPEVAIERPSMRSGSVGATQRNCSVDSYGNAYCR